MATLLRCIEDFIEKITVTDRQEENIKASVKNLTDSLLNPDSKLHIESVFTNGSYERDTIIRPLDDIDLFAVLKKEEWADEFGNLPNPQSVLSKIKDYLNGLNDYKDKVKQDRPCVTIRLSDKDFDVLPSFREVGGGYRIPNHDLKSWTFSYPEKLTEDLDSVDKNRSGKVRPTIKAVKQWSRENDKLVASFHIEEVAIRAFQVEGFNNYEESIRLWFNKAEYYLQVDRFKSVQEYSSALTKVKKVRDKLNDAKTLVENGKEDDAILIWKEIFGSEFPATDVEEAKAYGKSMAEGTLKVSVGGILSSTAGKIIPASKGFYGEE